jgi:uncharacterized protein HemX
MLIRIGLIIAIVAGLAVGGLNFVKVKEKIVTLKQERDTEKGQKEEAQRDLASTRKDLDTTKKTLDQTKQTLETTTKERDTAVAEAGKQRARADQLTTELDTTKKTLGDTQAALAQYSQSGLSAEQVAGLAKQLRSLQDEVASQKGEIQVFLQKNRKLETELAIYRDPDFKVQLPPALRGKVIVADPKWDFVVLDIGESQGILEKSELLVNRNGRLVAKVVVRSVQKDRSIANVIPGWKLGDVTEGDQVIPAYPSS